MSMSHSPNIMKKLQSFFIFIGLLGVSFFLGFFVQSQIFQTHGNPYILLFVGAIPALIATALQAKWFGLWSLTATVGTIAGAIQVNMGEGNLYWIALPAIFFCTVLINVILTGAIVWFKFRRK